MRFRITKEPNDEGYAVWKSFLWFWWVCINNKGGYGNFVDLEVAEKYLLEYIKAYNKSKSKRKTIYEYPIPIHSLKMKGYQPVKVLGSSNTPPNKI